MRIGETIDAARAAQVDFKIQVQEWKNTLLRGSDPEQFAKYRDAFQQQSASTRAKLDKVAALLSDLKLQTPLLAEATAAHEKLLKDYMGALAQYDPPTRKPTRSSTRWSRVWTVSQPKRLMTSSPSSSLSR